MGMEADRQTGANDQPGAPPQPAAASITLVLPAYNEQACIGRAIAEADEALAALTSDYEIIVVDDGSTDATAAIAEAEAARRNAVQVLRQPHNAGYGAALRRGFAAATKELVGFTDADCQFDLRELDRFLLLARDYDIVWGYRIERQDSCRRKFYSSVYNGLVRMLLGTAVRDCDCALNLSHRDTLQSIQVDTDGFLFSAQLLARARLAGHALVEVGVSHRRRLAGESKVSLRSALPVGGQLLRFWWTSILFPPARSPANDRPGGRVTLPEALGLLVLFLAAALLLLANLSYPMIEPDESRYAQIALEMLQSGDYVTPTLDGQPYLDKPPLLYWLTAASYWVFGAGQRAARLPCALAAWLTVVVTWWLGRRLVGGRAAALGALLLLLCAGFVLAGRFLIMDSLLTLMTTVGLLAAFRGGRERRAAGRWWLLAGVASGLGVLAKGPVALLLCLPPIAAYHWLTGGGRPRWRHGLLFFGSAAAVAAPWFMMITAAQADFAGYYFWKHHVVRFVSGFDHQQPWWFYLPVLLAGMFPCSLLLPPLAVFLASRREQERRWRSPALGFLLLAAVWVVGFFSLSSCKLPPYILPTLPLLCLLLGKMVAVKLLPAGAASGCRNKRAWRAPGTCAFWGQVAGQIMSRRSSLQRQPDPVAGQRCPKNEPVPAPASSYFRTVGALLPKRALLLSVGVSGVLAGVSLVLQDNGQTTRMVDWALVIAAPSCLLLLARAKLPVAPWSWGLATAVVLAAMSFGFDSFLPRVAARRSIHFAAAQVRTHAGSPSIPIVYFGRDSHSATLLVAPDKVQNFAAHELPELNRFVQRHPRVVIVTSKRLSDELAHTLPSAVELRAVGGRGRIYLTRWSASAKLRVGSRKPVLRQ